nr:hypothetical protein [Mucilaginibacter sp. X4EP1]
MAQLLSPTWCAIVIQILKQSNFTVVASVKKVELN